MVDNLTKALTEFEELVKAGKIVDFWVTVGEDGLAIQTANDALNRKMHLTEEMFTSLSTFFYGIERIVYRSQDYRNLKCFINTRKTLDRLLHKDS